MVQPDKNPSADEPFRDRDASEKANTGLDGVVEELRNVLSGLGEEESAPDAPAPAPVPEPEPADNPRFPFSPLNETPPETPPAAPTPSDADFWNGNVLGWADKKPGAPLPAEPAAPTTAGKPASVAEPFQPESEEEELEPEKPPPPSIEDLLPPLPLSPFDVEEKEAAPAKVEKAPLPLIKPVPPPEEEPAVDVVAEKPEGLVQIACVYPQGQEKLGQQFVTTLRGACDKAKLPITIQAVFIQPWAVGKINVAAWSKAAHMSGADRIFILTTKKDQDQFKNAAADAAAASMKSRLVLVEHVGLRTLYADILVSLRRAL